MGFATPRNSPGGTLTPTLNGAITKKRKVRIGMNYYYYYCYYCYYYYYGCSNCGMFFC